MGSGSSKAVGPKTPVDMLSAAQLEEFQEAFDMFDKDGGGSIDAGELKELLASVGEWPTDDEIAYMVNAVDVDNTGDIDFAEFAALMAHKMKNESTDEVIAAAFQTFDHNGDGKISTNEMRSILVNLGEPVSGNDVEQVIAAVDTDGDGSIDYREFAAVILGNARQQSGKGSAESPLQAGRSLSRSKTLSFKDGLGEIYSHGRS